MPDANAPTTAQEQQVLDEIEWAKKLATPRAVSIESVLLAEILISIKALAQ